MIYSLIKAYVIIGLINGFITVVAIAFAFNNKKDFVDLFGYDDPYITEDNLELAEEYYYRNWFSMLMIVTKAIIFWPKDVVECMIKK